MTSQIKTTIRNANLDLFNSADDLFDFSYKAIEQAKNIGRNRTLDMIQAVTALHVKCLRLFKSALILAEEGLVSESLAINRIAFESLLYLQWIEKDDDSDIRTSRCTDLLAWQVLTRNKMLMKIQNEDSEPNTRFQETIDRLKPYIEKLQKIKSPEEWQLFKDFGPIGDKKNRIEDLAKNLGMYPAYNRIYKMGSEVIHCQDLLDYAEKDQITQGLILKGFDSQHVSSSITAAIIIQSAVLSIVNRLLRLNMTDKIRIFTVKLGSKYPEFAEIFTKDQRQS